MIDIKTASFAKEHEVRLDGRDFKMREPGAGTSLSIQQNARRAEVLTKKVEAGTATEDEIKELDKREQDGVNSLKAMFHGDKDAMAFLDRWAVETPLSTIVEITEHIVKESKQLREGDGQAQTN